MGRSKKDENAEPQSPSIPGPTGDNPNEDVADGNQSRIQPGNGDPAVGTNPLPSTPGTSTPSDGGNPSANQGGASSTSGGQ